MPKVQVDSIVLRMGKETLTLSVEDARTLYRALRDLFEENTVPVLPFVAPPRYIIIEHDRWPNWWQPARTITVPASPHPQIWCCESAAKTTG